jgi:hypothetical protein
MKFTTPSWSSAAKFSQFLLLNLWSFAGHANPPAISSITISETGPRLSIVSDLAVTNQIESTTNLIQTNWVVLTNLLVTESPYSFVDTANNYGNQRFYRIIAIPANPAAHPSGMVLIPAGSFDMGDTFNEGESYEVLVHTVYVPMRSGPGQEL